MQRSDSRSDSRSDPHDALVPLSALDGQRLAPDEPDIRGWPLLDATGTARGRVTELLVERTTEEVAALAVASGRGDDDVFVVPMERNRIDDRRHQVVSDLSEAELGALPRLATSTRSRIAERPSSVERPGVTVQRTADGEVVRVPIVEEQLVVERRPVVREVIVIRKRARRDEQVVSADLRRERVDVERHGDVPPIADRDAR